MRSFSKLSINGYLHILHAVLWFFVFAIYLHDEDNVTNSIVLIYLNILVFIIIFYICGTFISELVAFAHIANLNPHINFITITLVYYYVD